MDILLAAHEGDLSFYMDDLLKKAELLAHSGDPRSCISLYHTYIQAKDSVNRLDIASRMDQLRTIYEETGTKRGNTQGTGCSPPLPVACSFARDISFIPNV